MTGAPGKNRPNPCSTNHLERHPSKIIDIRLEPRSNPWYNEGTMFRILQVQLAAKTEFGAKIISKHGRIWFRHCIGKKEGKETMLISPDLNPCNEDAMWIDRIPASFDFIVWEEQCGPLIG
jgi:hypothetical protein